MVARPFIIKLNISFADITSSYKVISCSIFIRRTLNYPFLSILKLLGKEGLAGSIFDKGFWAQMMPGCQSVGKLSRATRWRPNELQQRDAAVLPERIR